MSKSTSEAEGAAATLLVFRVAEHICAIDCGVVQEIVPMAETSRPPAQPAILEGFLDVRGESLPVVRARALFGLPPLTDNMHAPVLLLRWSNTVIGLLVDRADEVATVAESEMRPLEPGHTLNDCAASHFEMDGRKVVRLDPERLLLKEEQRRLQELKDLERQRRGGIE